MKTLIAFSLLIAGSVYSQTPTPAVMTVNLAWDSPVASDNVASTRIYEKISGVYKIISTVPQPSNITSLIGVPVALHTYTASFINASGIEGQKSNEITIGVPGSPQNLKATVILQLTVP